MSESPYTGYVELWTDRFQRLMGAKARMDAAARALLTAQGEHNSALAELNQCQDEITVSLNDEIKDAPFGSLWKRTNG